MSIIDRFLGSQRYDAALPTRRDGDIREVQCDWRGRTILAIGDDTSVATETESSTTWVNVTTPADVGLVSATPKHLGQFWLQSTYGAAGWIQLHDVASLVDLTPGDAPAFAPLYIAANGLVTIPFPRAKLFSTGIVWAFSSTPSTYTAVGAATLVGSFEVL